jgi:hypothetical protein
MPRLRRRATAGGLISGIAFGVGARKTDAVPPVNRRRFLALSFAAAGCARTVGRSARTKPPARFFFVSQGRTALMNADGSGLRFLDVHAPNQVTWQPGPMFPDGRRVVLLSMEARRDGPGRPFEEYYTKTPTHIWSYDLDRGSLMELATRERMAVFYTPAALIGEDRLLVQVVKDKVGQIFSMNLDGTDAREFTQAGEGLPYGLSVSPDGARVAFHLASPHGYEVWTAKPDGSDRVKIAGDPDHLFFGPQWSAKGRELAFVDCRYKEDPGHDWGDVCLAPSTGGGMRRLTTGQAHWFAATYGPRERHGGGSNILSWTRDGGILHSPRLPGSRTPWAYQAQRPDTDHFNREFLPEQAAGGVGIAKLKPKADGTSVKALTGSVPGLWDCRASESPDGEHVIFCRARTGGATAVWRMDPDGRNARELTRGLDESGADHPRWIS